MSEIPSLLGRECEMAVLEEVLANAKAGQGRSVIICGGWGTGKTSVLEHVLTKARESGFEVRKFAATPATRGCRYGAAAGLAAPVGSECAHDAGPMTEWALFEDFFAALEKQEPATPLVLGVDDADWIDPESFAWLSCLSRRAEGLPVVVLMTRQSLMFMRDQPDWHEILEVAQPILLGDFGGEQAADLVRSRLHGAPDSSVLAACVQATSGNPCLLSLLATALRDHGGELTAQTVDRIVDAAPAHLAHRMALLSSQLTESEAKLAGVVAMLGTVELDAAAHAVGLDVEQAAVAFRSLARRGLVVNRTPLSAVSDVLRRALASMVPAVETDLYHRRIAGRLMDRCSDVPTILPHLLAVDRHGDPRAVSVLSAAADRALADGDLRSAVALLGRALREPAAERTRHELKAKATVGRLLMDAQADCWAPPCIRATSEGGTWHRVTELAVRLLCAGDLPVSQAFDAVRTLADTDFDEIPESVLLARTLLADEGERVACGGVRPDVEEQSSTRVKALTAALWTISPELRRDSATGGRLAVLADAPGAVSPDTEVWEFELVAKALLFANEPAAAFGYCDRFLCARRLLSLRHTVEAYVVRAEMRLLTGALTLAEADARTALARLARTTDAKAQRDANVLRSHAVLINVATERGDVGAVLADLEAHGTGDALPRNVAGLRFLEARAAAWQYAGELDSARADATACGTHVGELLCSSAMSLFWWSRLISATYALGSVEEARTLAEESYLIAKRYRSGAYLGTALRQLALVAEGDDRLRLLREAEKELESSPLLLEHARLLADLGTELRRTGEREAGTEHLVRAHRIAEECGAHGMARSLPAVADSPAGTPAPEEDSSPGERASHLTAHERRIAVLVTEGRSNREIADKLSVRRRTIEFHLTNIYRKLGISRRAQLVNIHQALTRPDGGGPVGRGAPSSG